MSQIDGKRKETYLVKQLVEKNRGISYGVVQPGSFFKHGIPFIRVNNLTEKKLNINDVEKISPEVEYKYKRTRLDGTEILISLVGSLGHVALVNDEMKGWNVARAIGVLPIKLEFDRRWIYWYLKSPKAQHALSNAATTSVQATINLKELQEIEIDYPDESYRNIANTILSALDDKIELNRRTNHTLEQMAQTLFKNYFVDDIDPDKLPEGWRWGKLEDLCAVNINTLGKAHNFKVLQYIEISEVSKGNVGTIAIYERGKEPSRARRLLNDGDTVLSTVRPDRGAYFLAINPPANLVVSTGFAVFSPKQKIAFSFINQFLIQEESFKYYGFMAHGAAYPAINPITILNMEIPIPSIEAISEYNGQAEPLLRQISNNNEETKTLKFIRDSLLPKLMSGEIKL
jgi:type I restriction enzyme S subunit